MFSTCLRPQEVLTLDTNYYLKQRHWQPPLRLHGQRKRVARQVTITHITRHAHRRATERAIAGESIAYALLYGRAYPARWDRIHYVLHRRDLPHDVRRTVRRFQRIVVVVAQTTATLITVYERPPGGKGSRRQR